MSDIAVAAGISRAALYLSFNSKQAIFAGVLARWTQDTVMQVEAAMAAVQDPAVKLQRAFEVWVVIPFEWIGCSPAAKDLIECSLAFAQDSLRQGYQEFEAEIFPVLASLSQVLPSPCGIAPARMAHVLASAMRGFQQTATTAAELRKLIANLLALTCVTKDFEPGNFHATRAD